jgi:hypothetical protein
MPGAQPLKTSMSYESNMLARLAMPNRAEVGRALLRTLLRNGGVVKEFGAGQEVVDQLADEFHLNRLQRSATLETIYRKENRLKKTLLWHRLLFRAADLLAAETFGRDDLFNGIALCRFHHWAFDVGWVCTARQLSDSDVIKTLPIAFGFRSSGRL